METPRTEKALIAATRTYATEDPVRSWWSFLSTVGLLILTVMMAARTPIATLGWLARGASSALAALLTVRTFILYHDHLHGALLRNSAVARFVMWVYGVILMTPPTVWRETHNYHHANTAKIIGSHVGSYMMVTTGMWEKMNRRQRFEYKVIRHPLTILMAYFTLFMFGMGISPFLRSPKKHWASAASVALNWTATVAIIWKFGFVTWLFAMYLPLALAMAMGGYLFYAQHNFPDIHVFAREKWTYAESALESSSYMKMGRIMAWFTGNIGYHHVHHLNQMVPFYRLPEAMDGLPELQNPHITSWRLRDMIACFRLKLWDPQQGKMVGYPPA